VPLDDRIPQMSETELLNLEVNATRLKASGSAPQKAEAQRILPLVAAALVVARANKSEAMQKAKAERREAADASRKKKAASKKAEQAERSASAE
jgi:hypothetical protein